MNIEQKKQKWFTLMVGLIFLSPTNLISQYQSQISKFENPAFSLKKRIFITLKQILHNDSIKRSWIGYAIKLKDSQNICLIQHNNGLSLTRPSLNQLIKGDKYIKEIKNKECAILMDYSLESGRPRLYQIFIVLIDDSFDLKGKNLFWLGNISQKESYEWLRYLFYHNQHIKQAQMLKAISYHTTLHELFEFHHHIVFGKFNIKLKEDSIFWLGRYACDQSDRILGKIIMSKKDINLTKKAILSLSQSKSDFALTILSLIAQHYENKDVRKEAIFSLSQMENEKSLSILNKIVTNDVDSEIREFGVFVISQVPNKNVFPILQKISKTHPDVRVRKKAYFWADKCRNLQTPNYSREAIH